MESSKPVKIDEDYINELQRLPFPRELRSLQSRVNFALSWAIRNFQRQAAEPFPVAAEVEPE